MENETKWVLIVLIITVGITIVSVVGFMNPDDGIVSLEDCMHRCDVVLDSATDEKECVSDCFLHFKEKSFSSCELVTVSQKYYCSN